MADENIHPDLVEIALENSAGSSFEHFVHAFFPALLGVGFIPLGGMHDGGADAFQANESYGLIRNLESFIRLQFRLIIEPRSKPPFSA